MTIKQLEYFLEVAKTLNYTTAARNLFISQPALSRSIFALEEELDAVLFDRNRHKVTLTPAGMTLMSSATKVKNELDKMVVLVQQAKDGLRGHLTLGIQEGLELPPPLSSAISYLQEESPFIELVLISGSAEELKNGLKQGHLDVVYVYDATTTDSEHFHHMVLGNSAVSIAISSHLSEKSTDLETLNYIFVENESEKAKQWIHHCQRKGFDAKITYVPNTSTQLFLIKNGYGAGLFPQDHDIYHTCVNIAQAYNVDGRLYWRMANPNPIVAVFLELIRGDI